jgi:hypothetical protein
MVINRNVRLLATLTVAVISGAGVARATLLSDLLSPGQTVTVGELLFDDFTYQQNGDMPAANAINVTPFISVGGNHGLQLQGAFTDFLGGGNSEAQLGYRVTVVPAGVRLASASLSGVPTVLGGTGSIGVSEGFLPTDPVDSLNIFSNVLGLTQSTDTIGFASPVTSMNVQQNVLALATSGVPTLSFFTRPFSTVAVPEPGSATLLGIALTALVGRLLRRNSTVDKRPSYRTVRHL